MRTATLVLCVLCAVYVAVMVTSFNLPLKLDDADQSELHFSSKKLRLNSVFSTLPNLTTPVLQEKELQYHPDVAATGSNRDSPDSFLHLQYGALTLEAQKFLNSENFGSNLSWLPTGGPVFKPCAESASTLPGRGPSARKEVGYLVIQASGGLNQMRIGICDAVAVARILNTRLVLPILDNQSWWTDKSSFGDIFNASHFIASLASDVTVVPSLPPHLRNSTLKERLVPRYASATALRQKVLPVIRRFGVAKLVKFDYRLADEGLPLEIQQLRCRANYHALRFTDKILNSANLAVERLRGQRSVTAGRFGASSGSLRGSYVGLHLRFEPDMLAFSGCEYGGGEEEEQLFTKIRKRWPQLRPRSPEVERRNGKCPLTPEEIGLLLAAFDISPSSRIFVASGEIHGGEASLAPLRKLYPHLESKESLLTPEELAPFGDFASQRAAIDYQVCLNSDVFVANNVGNMAAVLAGHRRYRSHQTTITPHGGPLAKSFIKHGEMIANGLAAREVWSLFRVHLRHVQRNHLGQPREPRRTVHGEISHGPLGFHSEPWECLCKL